MSPPRGRGKLGPYSISVALACFLACGEREPTRLSVPATGPFTIALTGDTFVTRPLDAASDPAFQAVRRTIADATIAFTNLDQNLLGPEEAAEAKKGPPRWPFGSAREAQTLVDLGFDIVSLANDHAADYGADGLGATRRLLDRAGLRSAGAGDDLAQARAPAYFGRRVAVIAVTTSFTPDARATASRENIQGRPGVNALRYAADITVDPAAFQALKDVATFGPALKQGDRTSVVFTLDEQDERGILDEIQRARQTADAVVVSVHSHEPANASATPADFLQRFARDAIDAGALAIAGHGPHRLRGIERYKGGVIFYSLGNFLYQTKDVDFGAANAFDAGADLYALAVGGSAARGTAGQSWCSGVVAALTVEQGALTSIRLRPIHLCSLGGGAPGAPRAAGQGNGSAILRELEDLSRPYGTIIQRDNSDAVVR